MSQDATPRKPITFFYMATLQDPIVNGFGEAVGYRLTNPYGTLEWKGPQPPTRYALMEWFMETKLPEMGRPEATLLHWQCEPNDFIIPPVS